MRVLGGGLALVLLLLPGLALTGSQESPTTIEQLIRQLSSPKFSEREAATRKLESMGEEAIGPLKKALSDSDLEIRRRVERILPVVEHRVEAARLLAPTRLRLVYQDTPLPDALRDFAEKSGYNIRFDADTALPQRKITLDTGETTFWEALAHFCAKGDVSDSRDSAVPHSTPIQEEGPKLSNLLVPEAGVSHAILLSNLRVKALPTHFAGALRLRALPLDEVQAIPKEQRFGFVLEAAVEPKAPFRGLVGVKIESAVDEQGRRFAAPEAPPVPPKLLDGPSKSYLPAGVFSELSSRKSPFVDLVPLRWQVEKDPPARLKEVSGIATIRMQATRPLITVDQIARAAGRTVPGIRGGWIKVVETKQVGEEFSLRVQLRAERMDPGIQDFEVKRAKNGVLVMQGNLPEIADLVLEDAKGVALKPVASDRTLLSQELGSGVVVEYLLKYRLAPGQGEPERFLYTGPRILSIEVPFLLRDVPLSK